MAFDPTAPWVPPTYAGTDPAYQQWLAGAQLSAEDAMSQARLKRAQLAEQERQALFNLDKQAVNGRRTIQNNMLARGIFQSGETGRRQQEYDTTIQQGRTNADTAYQQALGGVDQTQQSALANLGMTGATQVSQAMLRDALAQYTEQQRAASLAPPTPVAAPAAAPAAAPSSYAAAAQAYAAAMAKNAKVNAPAAQQGASHSPTQIVQQRGGLQ